MTEIIKRLNDGLKSQIPDDKERIKHIMEEQVYACAPTNIIYNMVKNYVYEGFDYVNGDSLIEIDLSIRAEKGWLESELRKKVGKEMKIDVVIGNLPYQEEQEGYNKTYTPPIYHKFMDEEYSRN